MVGTRRNLWVAAGLLASLAVGAALLPSTPWACGLAAVLGLAGVVLLRGNRWRSGALLASAVAIAVGLLDLMASAMTPAPIGQDIVRTFEPKAWILDDAALGYRLRPSTKVLAHFTRGPETLFRVTYTINPDGTRATPAAPAGADTYLFLGDSFMFGQGLTDGETVPAQFAEASDFKVRTINFAVPGYAPNQWVRALELGQFDSLTSAPGKVKAVVTWIIPHHLDRVAGEQEWLGAAPRYVIEGGVPRHTGTFTANRLRNPLEGLRHVAGEQFAFVKAIGQRQRQEEEIELFIALMLRLQTLARERLGAPLIAIYTWPDRPDAQTDRGTFSPPQLIAAIDRLREKGLPLLRVYDLTAGIDPNLVTIPHDGHPSALTDRLIAGELKRRLLPPSQPQSQ